VRTLAPPLAGDRFKVRPREWVPGVGFLYGVARVRVEVCRGECQACAMCDTVAWIVARRGTIGAFGNVVN